MQSGFCFDSICLVLHCGMKLYCFALCSWKQQSQLDIQVVSSKCCVLSLGGLNIKRIVGFDEYSFSLSFSSFDWRFFATNWATSWIMRTYSFARRYENGATCPQLDDEKQAKTSWSVVNGCKEIIVRKPLEENLDHLPNFGNFRTEFLN